MNVRIAPWRSAVAGPIMSSVTTLRHWLGRLGKDTLYLLTGLPMGILSFTVAVTGWSLGLGMLITLIGFPILLLTILLIRGLAHIERARAELVSDEALVARYKQPAQSGIWARVKTALADPQNWRDLGWSILLLPVGIAGFTIGVTAIATVLGLIFAPAWTWALWDAQDPPDLGLFHITDIWTSLAATAIGIALIPLGLALVRGSAAASGVLARALLAPRTEELEERVEVLQATRAGAVDAAAAELERIERDLHDGAQARLVAIAMDLGLAQQKLDEDPEHAKQLLAEARDGATAALVELRDLARGIRPALLAERGLAEAVRAFAARSPVPATVSADIGEQRLPEPVESAAYFVVAEALANVAKHANARRATVSLVRRDDKLEVLVVDDGHGGANPDGGGLNGLRARVEALDGTLGVASPAGGPTMLRAELPCGS
jgi:signal transduction histidine kinase